MARRARSRSSSKRGVSPEETRRLLLDLPGVEEGRSYGMPSFLAAGRFLARFRDHDEVLVIQLGSIDDRDVLMQIDPEAFFFTDHYRDYPAVLVRLAEVQPSLLREVLEGAREQVASLGKPRKARAGVKRTRR